MPSPTQDQLDQILRRVDRIELALYGDPNDTGKSTAMMPVIRRASAYMDAACMIFRAILLAIPAAMGIVVTGRQMGWW